MKTVLITGAASSIWKALALKFYNEGYDLLLTYKDVDAAFVLGFIRDSLVLRWIERGDSVQITKRINKWNTD